MPSDFDDDPLGRRTDDLFRALELDTEQLVDPLPAARVRALGDRRRTRRRATTAVGGLAAIALVAGGAWTIARPDGPTNPQVAGSPTPSSRVSMPTATRGPIDTDSTPTPSSTPSAAASPASASATATTSAEASETPSADPSASAAATPSPSSATTTPSAAGSALDWSWAAGPDDLYLSTPGDVTTGAGGVVVDRDEHASMGLCDVGTASRAAYFDLGQSHSRREDLTGSGGRVTVTAYVFPDTSSATKARQTIRSWYRNCVTTMANGDNAANPKLTTAVDLPVGSAASAAGETSATYRFARVDINGSAYSDAGTLLQVGNRLQWIVASPRTWDSSLETSSTAPAVQKLPGVRNSAELTNRMAG